MADKITFKSVPAAGCAALAVCAGLAIYSCQFGPFWTNATKDRLLASAVLSNGSELFLSEHWAGNLVEPYAVRFYRLDRDDKIYVCFLGDEYSHWWGSKLTPSREFNAVDLIAFGETQGTYSVSNGFVWFDSNKTTRTNWFIDGVRVNTDIPEFVMSRMHIRNGEKAPRSGAATGDSPKTRE